MDFERDVSLKEWARDKPLSILQLDPADRAVLRIADERDAIQKKTFTKWVNKHLKKANRHVNDLFIDLQDGLNLISLLEVLSGEHLPREKGRMRFHMLQNVELVLNFLRYKKIKLVNIRPEDIVDGNPKLTLGLIWTIILHFQISDIVVGEEPNVSAKDVLLRWAKKSTNKYPGVKVSDFTSSWRDGLAFNAIIHRNRPDLLPEWREIRRRTVRERLETAFYTAEKVGVTRLLDPEDVDTHEIDEKSIITYISSLYDAFPEPPFNHPLYDNEAAQLTTEYREVASSLHMWLRQKISDMSSEIPGSLEELKRASAESSRFRSEEVPLRSRERQKLASLYRDLQKLYESTGEVDIEPELHIEVLERNWSKLMSIHQERDHAIQEEIKKLERLQRLAEKVSRDCKRTEPRLDDLDSRINEEAKRLDRLHPLDAKHVVDGIEAELRSIEDNIQSLFHDVSTLKSGFHPQSSELNKRVSKLHQRWVGLRSLLHSKLIARLASLSFPVVEERTVTRQTRTVLETRLVDTNHHFRALQEAEEWVRVKLKQLQEFEFSPDLAGSKIEMTHHQREHREIDRFQATIDQCASARSQFHGEELSLYTQHLSGLQKSYAELLSLSNKRLSEFESLVDFLESLNNQISWLKDKEAIEVARDWSDREINLTQVQSYYESLMVELERAENVIRSVLERGEALLLQGHSASKAITQNLHLLQNAWSRVLQLTLALEVHIASMRLVQAFFRDVDQLRDWIQARDEILNTTYSQSEFSLDEGERLLRGMQDLREELNARSTLLAQMSERAEKIPPVKQRRSPVIRPIQVTAVCDYKSESVEIEKGDQWILHDNSAITKWRVSPIGSTKDTNVPGVVFAIPPPSKEARDAIEQLAKDFERTLALWQRKQLRLRQNMIFTTIRVVRSWDLAQFVAMGSEQRNAIRKALNEDADKLLSEGDPNDPQLRRLRREMAEVNKLFDEFELLANQQEENKQQIKLITEKSNYLQEKLDEYERILQVRLANSIPRDIHSLEHMVVQHKEFENNLKDLTPEIESLQNLFNNLTKKSPGIQSKVEGIVQQWNAIWNSSHVYVERLKCVEIVQNSLEEATNVVSELELKLATFAEMPSELAALQQTHDDLIRVQNQVASQQPVIDQMIEDATNTRRVVVKSREKLRSHGHVDLDRLDDDVNSVTQRWNNLCASLVDRLRSCESAYSLLDSYGKTYQTEIKFIDESYSELNNLPPVSSQGKQHITPTKVLFTSIVERTQPLEQVNIDGGRFIREAKIYNLGLGRFRAAVAVSQPSYDPETALNDGSGEEVVAEQLDVLNQRFLALVSILQDRLRQIGAISNDQEFRDFVANLKPVHLKTFRTEFTLVESSTQLPDSYQMYNSRT